MKKFIFLSILTLSFSLGVSGIIQTGREPQTGKPITIPAKKVVLVRANGHSELSGSVQG